MVKEQKWKLLKHPLRSEDETAVMAHKICLREKAKVLVGTLIAGTVTIEGERTFPTEEIAKRWYDVMVKDASVPEPVELESRICFGIAWFATESDAYAFDAHQVKIGQTYNGGWYDGQQCGRDKTWDRNGLFASTC